MVDCTWKMIRKCLNVSFEQVMPWIQWQVMQVYEFLGYDQYWTVASYAYVTDN